MFEPDDPSAELVLNLVDGAVRFGGAVLEQDDPVAEALDFLELVGVVSSVRRAGRGLIAATEFIMHFMALKAGERGQDD